MRSNLPIALIVAGGLYLVFLGFRPDALPFIPEADFSDAVISHWPAALFLRQSILQNGEFPLWWETIMGGQPFAANPLNKTAYPLQWLALIFPGALHLNILILLHLLIAGWGMWRWAKDLNLSSEAAALSAVAYAFAPKLIAHLGAGHLDLIYALAWWPWLMWSVYRSHQSPENRLQNALRTALLGGLIFLADVRMSLFALTTVVIYDVWQTIARRQWRHIFYRLPSILLFFLLVLSVIVPFMLWRPYLSRSEIAAEEAGIYSLEAIHFSGLALPPHSGEFETLTYLGLPVLVLALIALFSDFRKLLLWFLLIVFAALYALGFHGFLWPLLTQVFPGLLWFRVPSRAWFILVLIVPLLAGYGLQRLSGVIETLRSEQEIRWLAVRRLAIAGLLGASLLCGFISLFVLNKPPLEFPPEVAISVILGGTISGIILLVAYYGLLKPQSIALLLVAITMLDLGWFAHSWLEWRTPSDWLTPYESLARTVQAENPARIYSPDYSLPQQAAAAYDLRLFGGVDPFQIKAVNDAIQQGGGIIAANYSVVQPPLLGEADASLPINLDTQILATWDVSHVISSVPLDNPRLQIVSQIDDVSVYVNADYQDDGLVAWPDDWPGLPAPAEIAQFNQWTIFAALASAVTFVGCGIGLAISARLHKSTHSESDLNV
jgi:hypothetical protein